MKLTPPNLEVFNARQAGGLRDSQIQIDIRDPCFWAGKGMRSIGASLWRSPLTE